jgi:hypothetical protein
MAECVSSQFSDAGSIRSPLKRLPHTGVGIRQSADLHGTCKDPIRLSSKLLALLPQTQTFQQFG